MGVYDLALACVYGIAHRERCIVLLSHACAYSLYNSIGAQGVQHIAAALAHNSTLQTLE
jgi:hypothetical protein